MTARDDRAISTALDVALFLVLLGAAATTVAVALDADEGRPDPADADRTAETLSATTATVEYSLGRYPANHPERFDGGYADGAAERVAHGPTAGLIADAAVADARAEGTPLGTSGTYERALDGAVRNVLAGGNVSARVDAAWRPYDGAPIEGEAAAGPSPPPDGSVSSATLTVPSGIPSVADEAAAVARSGGTEEDVAAVVASAIVEGYFPPAESQRAIESGGFERDLTVHRYLRTAAALDGVSEDEIADDVEPTGDASAANQRLVAALTDYIADDFDRFEDPEAAAAAVSTGEATVVVRTW